MKSACNTKISLPPALISGHYSQEYILQSQDLLEDGSSIAETGTADSIGVKEMCKVLKGKLDGFTTKLETRRVSLVTCMEFHQMIRQVTICNCEKDDRSLFSVTPCV